MNPPELNELIAFLAPYPEQVQALALEGRKYFNEKFSPVTEIFWDATNAVCAGFTYTHDTRDNFFNLAVYAKHVTLIFPWGAKLHDPTGILKGEGNQVRNLRLTSMSLLEDPAVMALIDQASDIAVRPELPLEPKVLVRVSNGPKRRPLAR